MTVDVTLERPGDIQESTKCRVIVLIVDTISPQNQMIFLAFPWPLHTQNFTELNCLFAEIRELE
jgi:hypothetical protein